MDRILPVAGVVRLPRPLLPQIAGLYEFRLKVLQLTVMMLPLPPPPPVPPCATDVASPRNDVAIAIAPPALPPPPPTDWVKIAAELISTVCIDPVLSTATSPPLPPLPPLPPVAWADPPKIDFDFALA